jgi:hypothetical protein
MHHGMQTLEVLGNEGPGKGREAALKTLVGLAADDASAALDLWRSQGLPLLWAYVTGPLPSEVLHAEPPPL